jgi:long-chain fatty acid transport protein
MRFLLLGLGLLLVGTQQAKSGGFALFEMSTRVSGMMGAYVADGRDVSTIFFNPAGLAQLSGFNIQVGGVMIAPRTTFRGPYPNSVEETKMVPSEFILPHIYASYQVMKDLTVGVGIYAPFGLGSKWERDWIHAGTATETRLQTAVISPTVAYRMAFDGIGEISVGASLQIGLLSNATLERVATDLSRPTDGSFRTVRLEGEGKETYTGYSFGFMYKPMELISVGFSYRSQLELNLVGDATFTGLPESQFIPGTQGDLQIVTPANWTLGVSIRPNEKLTLNLDYVNWGWSSYDSLNIDFYEDYETDFLADINNPRLYDDVYQIRFGAEYIVNESLIVRGGLGFDKNPVPDQTFDPTLPDTDRLLTSLGATYSITKGMDIHLYYTFIRGAERLVDLETNKHRGYYNTYANLFGAGLSFAF